MKPAGLAGAGVLVTRPEHQAAGLAGAIADAGGRVVAFPVMDIVARTGAAAATRLAALPAADIVIFVSANAVEHGLGAARGAARLAAIGDATAAALENAGCEVDIRPDTGFDSEALLASPALTEVRDKCVWIVRGAGGRELLADTLRSRGAEVHYVEAYQRRRHRPTPAELDAVTAGFAAGEIDFVIAMSVQSLDYLLDLLPAACRQALPRSRLVTPSARVIKTAQQALPDMRSRLAASPHADDLVAAMLACPAPQTDRRHG